MDEETLKKIGYEWAKIEAASGWANAETAKLVKNLQAMARSLNQATSAMNRLVGASLDVFKASKEITNLFQEIDKKEPKEKDNGK